MQMTRKGCSDGETKAAMAVMLSLPQHSVTPITSQLTAGRLGGGAVLRQQHGHSKECTLVQQCTVQLVGLGDVKGDVKGEVRVRGGVRGIEFI